jgi:hypothetical protein
MKAARILLRKFSSVVYEEPLKNASLNLKYLDILTKENSTEPNFEDLNLDLVLLNNPTPPDLSPLSGEVENIYYCDGAYHRKAQFFPQIENFGEFLTIGQSVVGDLDSFRGLDPEDENIVNVVRTED